MVRAVEKTGAWQMQGCHYEALHVWVRRRLKMPKRCPRCKRAVRLDLANKGIYNRKLKNWHYLCRHCHMLEDGRLLENKKCRAVLQVTINNILLFKYKSMSEAAKITGVSLTAIANNLAGRSKSAGGFMWKYV